MEGGRQPVGVCVGGASHGIVLRGLDAAGPLLKTSLTIRCISSSETLDCMEAM